MTNEETKKKAIKLIRECPDEDHYMVFTLRGDEIANCGHADLKARALIFARFHALMSKWSGEENQNV